MTKYAIVTRTLSFMISLSILMLSAAGCTSDKASVASPSDVVSSREEEVVITTEASDAVSVMINGEKVDDVFLLQYNWYGKDFVSEDSLNKIMMDNYAPKGNSAPTAANNSEISFVFDSLEGLPSVVKLTQYANTVRANSGLPYDTADIELVKNEDNNFCFTLDYRKFKMFYYQLECEWENGNNAKYAFAVEKAK